MTPPPPTPSQATPGVFEYGIEFVDLGYCLEFVDLALRNASMLGMSRDDFNHIAVSQQQTGATFTLLLPRVPADSIDRLKALARTRTLDVAPDRVDGHQHTINRLLQRVQLVRRDGAPPDAEMAVLLFGAGQQDYRQWYTQLLDMGCREVRVGFVQPTDDNHQLRYLFLIGQAPRGFTPMSDWSAQRGLHARALTFYRLRRDDRCGIFVEWGYEYPAPRLEQLYDMDHPACRFAFVCADAVDADRTVVEASTQRQPYWLVLPDRYVDHIFPAPDQAFRLQAAQGAVEIDLQPDPDLAAPVLDLRVVHNPRSVVTPVDVIEAEIARHQQAIDDLQADRPGAHALRRESVYLAYVFEQPLGQDPDQPLLCAAGFRRLLDQPYSRLRHLLYAFCEDPRPHEEADPHTHGVGLHIVVDTQPTTYSQVWRELSSEVYIQRQQWHEWRLPLYVRNGDDLRPRLEDEALAPVIRDLIWARHGHPLNEPVLLRSSPRQAGPGTEGAQAPAPLEALYVKNMKPLTDDSGQFGFVNRRFSMQTIDHRVQTSEQLEHQLQDTKAKLTEHADEIEGLIVADVVERVDAATQACQKVLAHIADVVRQANEHNQAAATIEQTFRNMPGEWGEFVRRVAESTRNLLDPKMTAADAYRQALGDLSRQLSSCEQGLSDVKSQLENDGQEIARREQQIAALAADTAALASAVKASLARAVAQQRHEEQEARRVSARADRLMQAEKRALQEAQDRLAELETKVAELEAIRQKLEETRRQIQQRLNDIERLEHEIRERQAQNERDKESLKRREEKARQDEAECKKDRQAVEEKRAQVEAYEQRIKAERAKLDKERDAVAAADADLKQQELQVQAETEKVRSREQQVAAGQQSVQDRRQQLEQRRRDLDRLEQELRLAEDECARVEKEADEKGRLAADARQQVEHRVASMEKRRQSADQELAAQRELLETVESVNALLDQKLEQAGVGAERDRAGTPVSGYLPIDVLRAIRNSLVRRQQPVTQQPTGRGTGSCPDRATSSPPQ